MHKAEHSGDLITVIDWAALVGDSAEKLPNNEAKMTCSESSGRNIGLVVGTEINPQTTDKYEFLSSCSDVPTVPSDFERERVEESENSNPMASYVPAGGGAQGQSAPHKTPIEPACQTCTHRRRPGLSDGYCGERADLPPAYTSGHPLNQLPADGGASCTAWVLHPGFDTCASPGVK